MGHLWPPVTMVTTVFWSLTCQTTLEFEFVYAAEVNIDWHVLTTYLSYIIAWHWLLYICCVCYMVCSHWQNGSGILPSSPYTTDQSVDKAKHTEYTTPYLLYDHTHHRHDFVKLSWYLKITQCLVSTNQDIMSNLFCPFYIQCGIREWTINIWGDCMSFLQKK